MKNSEIIRQLHSMNDICYYIYPFPTGKLCLFGSKDFLQFVIFGFEVEDIEEIEKDFSNSITGEMEIAIEFLDRFILGIESKLPNLDLSGFTYKETALYKELIRVSFGQTISYGELAGKAGIDNGARFAGNAMAKNKFPIFIPCHRVVRASGDIGNYSSGRAIKKFLLEHERVITDKRNASG